MKKFIAIFAMMAMMAIMLPLTADAQTRKNKRYYSSRTNTTRTYRTQTYRRPSFYQRHRNVINIAAGTGAGALIGGIIGGKKGALIGAGVGAGSSAIYSYKIKPKKRTYYRRNY
ncbi:hypothetical protein BH20ACI1_BH20ACI1_00650 [soil metagenome]